MLISSNVNKIATYKASVVTALEMISDPEVESQIRVGSNWVLVYSSVIVTLDHYNNEEGGDYYLVNIFQRVQ